MNRKEHEQFHSVRARLARKSALLPYVSVSAGRVYLEAADNHERAANGEKLFAECCELVTGDDTAGEVQR